MSRGRGHSGPYNFDLLWSTAYRRSHQGDMGKVGWCQAKSVMEGSFRITKDSGGLWSDEGTNMCHRK